MKINRIDIKGEVYDIEAYKNPIPTGTVLPFAGITAPEGFLLCNGQEVSRFTYAKLYEVIGDTYGAGDGVTTFEVPNLVEKFIEGTESSVGQTLAPGLPNIKGDLDKMVTDSGGEFSGAFYSKGKPKTRGWASADYDELRNVGFDASRSNSIYGKSNTVQPPAVKMLFIIKD